MRPRAPRCRITCWTWPILTPPSRWPTGSPRRGGWCPRSGPVAGCRWWWGEPACTSAPWSMATTLRPNPAQPRCAASWRPSWKRKGCPSWPRGWRRSTRPPPLAPTCATRAVSCARWSAPSPAGERADRRRAIRGRVAWRCSASAGLGRCWTLASRSAVAGCSPMACWTRPVRWRTRGYGPEVPALERSWLPRGAGASGPARSAWRTRWPSPAATRASTPSAR